MTWLDDNRGWLALARKRWAPRNPVPCKVTAWMASPITWDGYDPITLEGALQCAVVLRETGRAPCDVFSGCPADASLADVDITIPIADTETDTPLGRLPISRCSIGHFSPDAVLTTRYIRKRPRAENYAAKVVNIAMAEYKASNQPVATVTCSHITFWCEADEALLRDLLTDCQNLGADRSGGLGAVIGWEVDTSERDKWAWLHDEKKRLRRTVPDMSVDDVIGFERRVATLRAPYWHKRTQCLCKVPIVEVSA